MVLAAFLLIVWALWVRWYRHRPVRKAIVLRELTRLRQALRAGQHPRDLGEILHERRKAWKVGSFVVKVGRKVMAKHKAELIAHPLGVRLAPSVREGPWLIQLYYRHTTEAAYGRFLTSCGVTGDRLGDDMHHNNIGVDRRDRWVAFDW